MERLAQKETVTVHTARSDEKSRLLTNPSIIPSEIFMPSGMFDVKLSRYTLYKNVT